MKTPENSKEKFAEFIAKKKFIEEDFYPGLADETIRPVLEKFINQAAVDFENVSGSSNPTDGKYQEKIRTGLSRFENVKFNLDTEDRERVCYYFEELMDIVGLESSNGQLNNFMYGFDPDELNQEN